MNRRKGLLFGILMILTAFAAAGCGNKTEEPVQAAAEEAASQTETETGTPQAEAEEETPAVTAAAPSPSEEPAAEEPAAEEPATEEPEQDSLLKIAAEKAMAEAVWKQQTSVDHPELKERTGRYHLTEMVQAGAVMSLADIAALEEYGMEMTLRLRSDGTGRMSLFEEKELFRWDLEQFSFKKDPAKYEWSEEEGIHFDWQGASYTFTKKTASELLEEIKAASVQEEPEEEAGDESIAKVRIAGADWIGMEGSDEKGLCVWYDVTNNTDGYLSPYLFNVEAVQDGRILEEGSFTPAEEEQVSEYGNRYRQLRPGVKIRSVHLFQADPEGGPVDYYVRTGTDDLLLVQGQFVSGELSGRPEEDFTLDPVEEIDWMDEIQSRGTTDDSCGIEFEGLEVTDSEGGPRLTARLNFSNPTGDTAEPYYSVYIRAVQDGVTLYETRSYAADGEQDLAGLEIPGGASAVICYEWALISDSPVAVEVYDWFSEETVIGQVAQIG